jgi:hypothetical protein
LGIIAENCVDADFNGRLSFKDRDEILKKLNSDLPRILPRLYSHMSNVYQRREPGAVEILRAVMALLQRLVHWVSLDELYVEGRDFVQVFRFLLQEEPTRLLAVECLKEVGMRRYEKLHHLKKFLEHFVGALADLLGSSEVWADLTFSESMAQLVSGVFSFHLERLMTEDKAFRTRGTGEYACLEQLVRMVAELRALASFKAAAALVPTWVCLSKQAELRETELVSSVLLPVMDVYTRKAIKLLYEDGSFPEDAAACEEFIDNEEYLEVLHGLRSRMTDLLKLVAEHYPACAVAFLKERLPAAISQYGALTSQTHKSESYRALEALAPQVQRLVANLPPGVEEGDPAVLEVMSGLVGVLLDWHVQDPLFMYLHCLLLEGFKRFYRGLGDKLWAVMERLFLYIEYRDPQLMGRTFQSPAELVTNLSQEALQVRRRGMQSLVQVANEVPDLLLPWLAQLCTRTQELMAKGEISVGQTHVMLEMLVVVSNALNDAEQRRGFLSQVLSEALTMWTSEGVMASVSSVDSVLESLGLHAAGTSLEDEERMLEQGHEFRRGLLGAMETFLGVSRRAKLIVQEDIISEDPAVAGVARAMVFEQLSIDDLAKVNPLAPMWAQVFPTLFALLRSLHGLWAPDVRNRLLAHPQASNLVSAPDEVVKAVLKAGGGAAEGAKGKTPLVRLWPMWLMQLRITAYQLLERACQHKVGVHAETNAPFVYYRFMCFLHRLSITAPTPWWRCNRSSSKICPVLSTAMSRPSSSTSWSRTSCTARSPSSALTYRPSSCPSCRTCCSAAPSRGTAPAAPAPWSRTWCTGACTPPASRGTTSTSCWTACGGT